ncbi:MAG: sorbitol-6-phosphate 2-dehydrogenase [Chloroflexota bacterium]|nr:sorbitol-6-phosphate 2-dehydrogenase [Chloroflexota bacterium]
MDRPLEGKNAIVTGGAQGLGQAICERLAAEGCHVVVADISREGIDQTVAAINRDHPQASFGKITDVTSEADVSQLVDECVERLGSLDIMVSNAGVLSAEAVDVFPAEKWMKVMEVNLYGYFLCAKHAARVMKAQKSGAIIQINSKSGKKGSYKNSAYAASKFGGIGLTQSIALELAEYGVRANAICPGNLLDSPLWVNSLYEQYSKTRGISVEEVRQYYIDQVPMKRGCTYMDVCNVLVFLASEQSNYMTGQAINVTGGQEMH